MYYFLINNRRPIKSKTVIRSAKQAQGIVKNTIVKDVKPIALLQYLYYLVRYEVYGWQ